MKYYPEVYSSDRDLPLKEFDSEENAIHFFKIRHGKDLMAVVLDNDPEIRTVWEDKKFSPFTGKPIC